MTRAPELSSTSVSQEDGGDPVATSLLGGYKPDRFLPHATWESLLRILTSRGGGTYALSGPRGSGKSWMMDRAGTWADEHGGLMVPFPSPSEYEPVAFLASISEVVAKRFQRYYDELTEATTRTAVARYRIRFLTGALLLYVFAFVLFFGVVTPSNNFLEREVRPYLNWYALVGLGGVLAATALVVYARREYRKDRGGLRLVQRRAEELQQQVRFAATLKDSTELGIEGKASGLGGRLKRASERQLVERPATLSSLIQGFRGFVELVAVSISGPVVIAVDELDKMSDSARVAQLLRDIKGIFDVPGASFLVSLSSEAARNLELGGVRTRNEFNSSFYAVFSVPPLTPEQCLELLRLRSPTFPASLGVAAGVLGGGVPREVVRIAELMTSKGSEGAMIDHGIQTTLSNELQAFLDEVLASSGSSGANSSLLGDAEKLALHDALKNLQNGSPSSSALMGALGLWSVNDESLAWQTDFQEEWRRLLVRLAVGGIVMAKPGALQSPTLTRRLQTIVATASLSAAVALIEFGAYGNAVAFGRCQEADACSAAEARLAAYLLAHGNGGFARDDLLRFSEDDDDGAFDAALSAFFNEGILRRTRVLIRPRWRLADDVASFLADEAQVTGADAAS